MKIGNRAKVRVLSALLLLTHIPFAMHVLSNQEVEPLFVQYVCLGLNAIIYVAGAIYPRSFSLCLGLVTKQKSDYVKQSDYNFMTKFKSDNSIQRDDQV